MKCLLIITRAHCFPYSAKAAARFTMQSIIVHDTAHHCKSVHLQQGAFHALQFCVILAEASQKMSDTMTAIVQVIIVTVDSRVMHVQDA